MKNLKKLCLVALSTIALIACGGGETSNAPTSTASSSMSVAPTTNGSSASAQGASSGSSATPNSSDSPTNSSTPSVAPSSAAQSSAAQSSASPSSAAQSSASPSSAAQSSASPSSAAPSSANSSSAAPSSEAPDPSVEAKARHDAYLAASESDAVTIRGKIMGYDKYPGNTNCNIYLQDGVYGYWVNNFPYAENIVGKSYEITAPGAGKSYPALNANKKNNPVLTELTGENVVEASPLALGADGNNFENSRNAKIEVSDVLVKAVDLDKKKFTFDYNGVEYTAECNTSTENGAPIAAEIATLAAGQAVQKIAGTWYGETVVHITDIEELKVVHPAATSLTVTAKDEVTSIQVGFATQLIAAIEPAQAYQDVVWSSSDDTVATVSETGLVKGVKAGQAVITAKAKSDENISATITITVTEPTGEVVAGQPWTFTFSKTVFKVGDTTKTLEGLDWTISGDGGYFGYDGTKGHQFGSSKKPYKTMSLSTPDYVGGINSITINTIGGSGTDAQLTVKVGETQIGETKLLKDTAADYTFTSTTLLTGDVKLEYTQTTSKAIYIKSISIN